MVCPGADGRVDRACAAQDLHLGELRREASLAGVERLRGVGRGRVAKHRMVEILRRTETKVVCVALAGQRLYETYIMNNGGVGAIGNV